MVIDPIVHFVHKGSIARIHMSRNFSSMCSFTDRVTLAYELCSRERETAFLNSLSSVFFILFSSSSISVSENVKVVETGIPYGLPMKDNVESARMTVFRSTSGPKSSSANLEVSIPLTQIESFVTFPLEYPGNFLSLFSFHFVRSFSAHGPSLPLSAIRIQNLVEILPSFRQIRRGLESEGAPSFRPPGIPQRSHSSQDGSSRSFPRAVWNPYTSGHKRGAWKNVGVASCRQGRSGNGMPW